jgi:glycosyltransferase involved in cell wall biosynthesis
MLSSIVMLEAVLHTLLGSYSRCVDRFIAPSKFYAAKIAEWGVPAEAIRYVPNFVNASDFRPAYMPGDAVLYFGRLVRQKGLHTLIRAAAAARCRLTIVGTGPERTSLQRHAAAEGVEVRFLGYLEGSELLDAIRSARAVVVPSEYYENAPMAILEAYALGKPVVGAGIGGIPELIRQDETGFLFDCGDVASLTATLRQVCDASDAVLREMGNCARRWVEADFSANIYRDRIQCVYNELGTV